MIVFDSETTGLLKPSLADLKIQPYMTEICVIKIDKDFNFINEIDTLIKPPIPISEEITRITGITDDVLKDAPSFIQVYDSLCDLFLGEEISIAHNNEFDSGVLQCELMRHGLEFKFPWPKKRICTVEKTKHIYNRRLKLGQLHEMATGKTHEGAHRAKADVHALIRCVIWATKEGHFKID